MLDAFEPWGDAVDGCESEQIRTGVAEEEFWGCRLEFLSTCVGSESVPSRVIPDNSVLDCDSVPDCDDVPNCDGVHAGVPEGADADAE